MPHPSQPHRDGWDPQTSSGPSPTLTIEIIGDRPGGCLPDDSPLLTTLRAVDRHLNLRTEPGLGSTDANIPLSLNVPAIAIGAGGLGGGIHTLRAVDRHLGIRTELRLGSTDANIPLSLGIPAAALAGGGTGGGIHTLAEWYDPTGRETALRRLLLTILDLAENPPLILLP